ncbi:MAG: ferrous iron transport protein A [Dehalococcoidia bacterium]|jgi:Fe2+ transport system protein FeoA|nr:ferrous iron transport protein A [Dehalococcoidia bacterium]
MEKKLSEMKYGEKGTVKRIEGKLRAQIAGMGIREGQEVEMTTKQPIKGPLTITMGRANTSLGIGLAEQIIVEVEG